MSVGDGFLNPDRLFSVHLSLRKIARDLYGEVRELPIVSPHGHTDPQWFADDTPFENAAALLVIPDHYVLRMMRSVGRDFSDFGVPNNDGGEVAEPREIWRSFARNYHHLIGTPSRLWIDHAMSAVLGCEEPLSSDNADALFDHINEQLAQPSFRPRALLDRFKVETIATTEGALDPLSHHQKLKADRLIGQVRTTYRPDAVTDPDAPGFAENLRALGELTDTDVSDFSQMIEAHRRRRAFFRQFGATATDHGVPTAFTADLPAAQKQQLLEGALRGELTAQEAELFRGQMLTEMAGLSVEDGMVMQIHAGSKRNTDRVMFDACGPNMGADIPVRTDWVNGLDALLNRYGSAPGLRIIAFTLDEATYARELAPMAGYWPSLMIGPPWWFHDSPEGMRRYFDSVVETAGYSNLAGFNDDTRALLSIPARHDVWRREVCNHLAKLVSEHRLSKREARDVAARLCYGAAKEAYRLP